MKNAKALVILLFGLMIIASFSFLFHVAHAQEGEYVSTETTLAFQGIDVTPNGVIYAGAEDTIYKSSDSGATWAALKTISGSEEIELVFVASNGYVYAVPEGASLADSDRGIWRSTDDGLTWSNRLLLDPASLSTVQWAFDEDASGRLFAGVYTYSKSVGNARIYRSTDNGATWTSVYYDPDARHVHDLKIDRATGYIYATVGDSMISPWTTEYILRSTDHGANWAQILGMLQQCVAICITPDARLFGSDDMNSVIYKTTDDTTYSTAYVETSGSYCVTWIKRDDVSGQIFASSVYQSGIQPSSIVTSVDGGNTWALYRTFDTNGFWYGSQYSSRFLNQVLYYSLNYAVYQNGWRMKYQLLGSPSWMDSSWTRRRALTIDNSLNPSSLVEYQVNVTVNFASGMKSDFSDLRFTSSDGTTLIPFWVESHVPSDSAVVWVNVPSIPASGTATVYMYYGNPSASSASNARSTFDFFDDFETKYSSGWTDKELLPHVKADPSAAVFGNQLYVFGGYDDSGYRDIFNSVHAYDPVSNAWTQKADMPTERWGPIAVQYGGKIYVFSGNTYGVEKYQGNPLIIPEYGAGSALHPDVAYFPDGKDGYKYWMMYTPYKTGEENVYENPCIVRSNDGIVWTDSGITNPIIPAGVPPGDLENPDPDFVYVSDYGKWFMVWDPGDSATNSRKIALAYSSDGKTWTQYGGSPVNGNTDPIILSGADMYGQAWERDGSGVSKTCTPTLLYESGVFYLYYAEEASGTNNGKVGLATFTWNNYTNSIIGLTRNVANPIIDLPRDGSYQSGIGHVDVAISPTDNEYFMYGVRELPAATSFELVLLTSSDKVLWTSEGTVLTTGASGQWDSDRIYRSCPTVDQTGKIVLFDNKIQLFYTGETGSGPTCKIGIAFTGPYGVYPHGLACAVNEIYDPTANTWTEGAATPIEIAGQGLMGVSYGNVIHLFYKKYHYVYDPSAKTYTRKADVPTPRTWGTCAVVNNKIYVIGGYSYDTNGNPISPSNVNQVYDPATDTWATKSPLPESIYGVTRENPVIGGKIYVTHGFNDTVFKASNYVYDPSANSWSVGSAASHPRDGTACGVIADKLYVVGGRADTAGPYGLNYNEEYGAISPWVFSDATMVYVDASAAHDDSYGLLINDNSDSISTYAEHLETLSSMVVDFDWDMTDALGTGTNQPQGMILLASPSSVGSGTLYYYNHAGTPWFEWHYNGGFTVLESGSWNTWYHISIVWAGANSQVIINDVAHPVTASAIASDRVRLQTSTPELSRAFYDNVRVRKYTSPEPSVSIGDEEYPVEYTLTVNTVGSGSVAKVPDHASYHLGNVVQLTATSNAGWIFSSWSGDLSGSANPASLTVTKNMTVTATFIQTAYLFSDGFESGDFTAWTGTITSGGGTVTASQDFAHHGSWSAKSVTGTAGSTGRVYKTVAHGTEMYLRDYFRISTLPGSSGVTAMLLFYRRGSNNMQLGGIRHDGANAKWSLGIWSSGLGDFTWVYGTHTPVVDHWYCLEMYQKLGSGTGEAKLWVDGTLEISQTGLTTRYTDYIDAPAVGVNTWDSSLATTVYSDCAVVDSSYIGPETYYLTVSSVGTGSVVKVPDQATYASGTVVTLTAVPSAGWNFSAWSGDLSGSVNPTTILIDGNKAVTANFIQLEYTLTVTVVGQGSVGLNASGPYHYGDWVRLTAAPNTGWTFSQWSGDASGTNSQVDILIDGDKSVTASFTQIEYTLTVTISPNGSGSVSLNATSPYHYGDKVQLTATPTVGWKFSSWSGDLTGSVNPAVITINGNKTVTATFTQEAYSLTLTVSPEGSGSIGLNATGPYHYGDKVELTANPAAGWTFSVWSGDLRGNANPASITMTGDKSVTATFTQDHHTLTVTTVGSGSVSKNPDQATYVYGEAVILAANPALGWSFGSWSGNLGGNTNPATIIMDGNKIVTATFTENQYTLTINTIGSGSVSKSPDQTTYTHGTVVSLTATPADGWMFSGWSGDLSGTENPASITMDGDKTVTATLTQLEYTLTINTVGSGAVTKVPDQTTYTYGTSVELTATSNLGWSFSQWTGDLTGSANPATITITGNIVITATFTEDQYTLSITITGDGAVTKSPDLPTYSYGSVVTLTATPNIGWSFGDWSGDLIGSENLTTITMTSDKSVTALFTQNQYTLDITIAGSGSVTKVPDQATYTYGTSVQLTATAEAGCTFAGWSGDLSRSQSPVDLVMDDNKIVTATFIQNEYTLDVSIVGSGSVAKAPDQATYHYNDVVELTAVPNAGWSFSGWSGGLVGNPTSVTITGDLTVTATFTQIEYSLTVNISPIDGGSVSKNPDSPHYHYNDVVQLTATPTSGYSFAGWSDGLTGNPTSVTITSDTAVTAYFTPIEYTLDVTVVGSGSVSKNPDQPTYHLSDIVQLTAVPSAGWSFSGWSGDLSGPTSPASITIDGNKVVTATFTQNQYTLTLNVDGSGSVSKIPDQATYAHGDSVQLIATPALGWSFSGWSGDATGSDNPITITMDGNKAVAATFTQNQYTLTINTVGSGSVSKEPDQATYTYGTSVQLTATPTLGWSFNGWSSDLGGNQSPADVVMDGDKIVTATFTQNEYTLDVSIVGSGSVTKAPDQLSYHLNDVVQLTAAPDAGWSFSGWSGDLTDSANPASVTIDGNMAVTATFTLANNPPVIDACNPASDPTILEGQSQEFDITYHDPDGDPASVQWYLNGAPTVTTDSYTFVADYGSAGTYNITVAVSDNCAQIKHEWTLTVVFHDVTVAGVTLSKTIVGQNFTMNIDVTVENQGNFTETLSITVYANNTSIQTLNVADLSAGSSTTITFIWNTTGFTKGNYTIIAYAEPVPGETDTADNTVTDGVIKVVTPGDVNADGVVDIVDVSGISAHWYPGPPMGPLGYAPNFDINNDGAIDILDVAIVSAYWTGPPKGPSVPQSYLFLNSEARALASYARPQSFKKSINK